ncbi:MULTISPECIES: hypothetical protein [unclassified Bacillus (in: firmicutes)]|uniref:hypothetical protein n=1 Tax=unclassified Bacillus (in: firmicutes) TaxID=185979 RepID=UPI0008EE5048|nr:MULTISPECIES: hypothetical protein [unclassified Bacillus (in: firmicutes)]SFI91192.1 hypothetical protein SAMN04488574_10580 [Bacillus sp. 71mf]SFS66204.1 hypothetical protein SAMN04488145_102238 [Bacillus sp. 103mf]
MKLSKKLVSSLVLSASLITMVGVGSASAAPTGATLSVQDSVNPTHPDPGGGSSWYYKSTYTYSDGSYVKNYYHYDNNGDLNGVKQMFFSKSGVFLRENIVWS